MTNNFYDTELIRRTSSLPDAYFTASDQKALRCINREMKRLFADYYEGQIPGRFGAGNMGDKIEMEGLVFEFMPGIDAWLHQGNGFNITLLESCSPISAAQWLRAFKDVFSRAPGFLQGDGAHHYVGSPKNDRSMVLLATGTAAIWFNHPNGFLFATGLAEATRNTEHETSTGRLILYSAYQLCRVEVEPWVRSLAADLNRAFECGSLEFLMNKYLRVRLKQRRSSRGVCEASLHDRDMASDILAEAYADIVIEGKDLPVGKWDCFDAVAAEMRQRRDRIIQYPPPCRPRIMHVPSEIDVPEELAERARRMEQGEDPL